MTCLTPDCIEKYLDKLEKSIKEFMEAPATQRSAEAILSMMTAYNYVKELHNSKSGEFTEEDAKYWNDNMVNVDGTLGGHWTIAETSSLGVPDKVSPYCWNVAMNMVYSDYKNIAVRYGVDVTEFYIDMAKAFLFDADSRGPKEKMAAYYHNIVK